MRFEFATAARIVFGAGAAAQVAPEANQMGERTLLVTTRSAKCDAISALACETLIVKGEPTVEFVRQGTRRAREAGCDMVIGFGGGSAIDAGKAIAALLGNGGDPLDYLEVVGRGQPLRRPSAPFIAVPTTAGTGSEVTRNAVLASTEHSVKASLRGAGMLPRLAVVDPELTLGLPPEVTASTGLDALTQLIEPMVSTRATPMTDLFAREGIRLAARSLARACEDGADRSAREDMSMASLLGGLCLANAGLGAVHGFAAPVGGAFAAPHGAVCAALLPHAMDINIRALRARGGAALDRYAEVARILTGRPEAAPEEGTEWVGQICRRLRIPALAAYGVRTEDVPSLVENAARASSMKGNPIALTPAEMTEILSRALIQVNKL